MLISLLRAAIVAGIAVCSALTVYADEYRVLAIRVDFTAEMPDHDTTSGDGTFDLRSYAGDPELQEQYFHPWDVPPHNRTYFEHHLDALANYWQSVSDGSMTITHDIWPREENAAYTMGNTFYKYGNGRTDEQTYEKLAGLVDEALRALKTAEGSAVDVSQYDTVLVIHAGIGSETSGALNDIPSAYLSDDDFLRYHGSSLVFDGRTIKHALVVPEMTSNNGNGGLNGIIAQMFGFRLGLPSLSNNEDGLPGAGGWALMDIGAMAWGWQTLGFIPTHPCIWSKTELGFVDPVTVTSDTTLAVAATHIDGALPRAVRIDITDDEYLLIENRFSVTPHDSLPPGITFSDGDSVGVWTSVEHYDAFIPASGILIWHITNSIIEAGRDDNSINNDSLRRGVDLLEADGIQDIGALFGFGDERSEYSIGHDDDTYRSNGTATISPSTNPDTGSIWGGSSGVTVTVNSEPGEVMELSISFAGKLPGFPVALPDAQQVTAVDLDGDAIDELVVSTPDSFYVLTSEGALSNPSAYHTHPSLHTFDWSTTPFLFTHDNGSITDYAFSNDKLQPALDGILELRPGTTYADGPQVSYIAGDAIHALMNLRTFGTDGSFDCNTFGQFSIPDSTRIITAAATSTQLSVLNANQFLALAPPGEITAELYKTYADTTTGPLLVDIDRDDDYETVITADRELRIYEPDGTYDTAMLPDTPVGDPVAADIDRDGYPEVFVATQSGIYGYRSGAAAQPGFPYFIPAGNDAEYITSQPVIGDLDNNGRLDIACATSARRMISFAPDGTQTAGFPFALEGEVTASPCLFRHDASGTIGVAYITVDGMVAARSLNTSISAESLPWPMWKGGPSLSGAFLNDRITSLVQATADFEAFCYPNPITGSTATFRIIPEKQTDVAVTLYTVDGQRVLESRRDASSIMPGVINDIPFNSADLASGLYIAKITSGNRTVLYKVGVMK